MPECEACGSAAVEDADGDLMCMDCGEIQEEDVETAGVDDQFKVGTIVEMESIPGKDKLKKLQVDIGDVQPHQIVTNAGNVKQGDRIVIALVGAVIGDPDDGAVVKKTSVGGVVSHGMVCDGPMLGWGAANKGRAAVLPETYAVGSAPPPSRPRTDKS